MRTGLKLLVLAFAVMLAACSSIDCPLNNRVEMKYKMAGEVAKLTDTLMVSVVLAEGRDSLVLNRAYDVDSFYLPVSYGREKDVIRVERHCKDELVLVDTVVVYKENRPHFESVDCGPQYFHTILGATTTQNGIDSLSVNNKEVNYDITRPHILLYFKSLLH